MTRIDRSDDPKAGRGASPMDRRAAEGFTGSEQYDAYRPSYPEETIAFIRRDAHLGQRSTVLDLAAGTGLMTRLLWPAGRLIAVEPLAEMRAVLAKQVPEAEILAGFADSIPLEASSVDAVVVAQAFHWFATPAAVREIARVLKPKGALALVWNKRDLQDPLMRAIHDCLDPYRGDSPDFENTPWREPFEAPDAPLRLVARQHISWDETITLEHLKGRICSISYIALLDDPEREEVLQALADLTGAEDNETPVTLRYFTETLMARHRPES
jgi:SAM-dependent methyltransferase